VERNTETEKHRPNKRGCGELSKRTKKPLSPEIWINSLYRKSINPLYSGVENRVKAKNMMKNKQEQLDVIDLIISTMMNREAELDKALEELTRTVFHLKEQVDKLEAHNETMLKYYEPINKTR
jgi:hypothetical protein